MRKSIHLASAFVLVGALALWGCSDSDNGGTGPSDGGDAAHFMKADFSGGYTGKLDATGQDMDKPLEERREMAGAAIMTEGGIKTVFMLGVEQTGSSQLDPRGHALSFFIFNPKVGTYSGGDFCVEDDPMTWAAGCSVLAIFSAADHNVDREAVMSEGTLKITALTDDRIAGTFEMSGESFMRPIDYESFYDADFDEGWESAGKLDVKNGQYDLAILDIGEFDDFFGGEFENLVAGEGFRLDAVRALVKGRVLQ